MGVKNLMFSQRQGQGMDLGCRTVHTICTVCSVRLIKKTWEPGKRGHEGSETHRTQSSEEGLRHMARVLYRSNRTAELHIFTLQRGKSTDRGGGIGLDSNSK